MLLKVYIKNDVYRFVFEYESMYIIYTFKSTTKNSAPLYIKYDLQMQWSQIHKVEFKFLKPIYVQLKCMDH